MNLPFPCPDAHRSPVRKAAEAFTLPEVVIVMTLLTMLVAGVVSAHLFGLSMFRITSAKVNATADARAAVGRLVDEIRASKATFVGNVVNGVFVARLDGEPQQGTGLLIYPTTNTSIFIVYFVNPADQTFRRTTSTAGTAVILAESVTNTLAFRALDHLGNVLTDAKNNRVIRLSLEFYLPQFHGLPADYYKLETAVTRRAVE